MNDISYKPMFGNGSMSGCCVCGENTSSWYLPENQPLCVLCSGTRLPEEIPLRTTRAAFDQIISKWNLIPGDLCADFYSYRVAVMLQQCKADHGSEATESAWARFCKNKGMINEYV